MVMPKTFAAVLSMVLIGCIAPETEITNEAQLVLEEDNMPPLVPVGPAVGGPFASIDCPVDGATIVALDIRRPVAALLRNDVIIFQDREVEYVFTDVPITPFVVGPPNSFSGNTWTDSKITLDIPNVQTGDDIKIHVWGNWQLNASSSPGDVVGRLRVELIEDVDGAPLIVPNLYGVATITDDGAALTLPHNELYAMTYRHRTVTPGKTRATVQVRSEDITGGAGTATLILTFSARMDITHVKRTVP
jgi:hypothetical protein